MGRRNDHSREEIAEMALQVAIALLEREGMAGLSARKIAKEIGYTVGTLYLVFENLDDLIFQANLRTLKMLHQDISNVVLQHEKPADALLSAADTYLEFARKHEHRWRLLYEHPNPESSPVLEEYKQTSKQLFAVIENSLEHLTTGEEVAVQARALWASVHGICILSLSQKLDNHHQGSVQELTHLLVKRFINQG